MPERRLERSKTAAEVCDELGGLMSPHALLRRARRGLVPGAFKIGRHVYFSHNTVLWMIEDLSVTSPAGFSIRIPKEGTENGLASHPPR